MDGIHTLQKQGANFDALPLPDAQNELLLIKTQIKQAGQYAIARQKLEALLKKAWQENLFEILPDILQNLMYCRHALGEYHQNTALFQEWERAIALQRDMNQMRLLSSQTHNITHDKNIATALETMPQLKRIVSRNKAYPRFALAYRFSHLLNGAATMGNTPAALTRHLKAYEQLRKAHPAMPGMQYEANHLAVERFRYLYAKGLYNYLKGNYKEFYQTQREAYQLSATVPELRGARSEAMFLNKIRTEILLGLYREALQTAREMQDFLKEQQLTANFWKTLLEMGRTYVYSYPAVVPDDMGRFADTLHRNLANAAAAMNDTEKAEAMGVAAILYFYGGHYTKALKTFEQKETVAHFAYMGVEVFGEIFKAPFGARPDVAKLAKAIKQQALRTDNAAVRDLLLRGCAMLDKYLDEGSI